MSDERADARPAGEKPRPRRSARNGSTPPRSAAAAAARSAVEQVVALTGRELESVVSLEPGEGSWRVGVEVVETRRIPDSADILALFEVEIGPDGDLRGYRRLRRYSRGQLHQGER